MLSTGRFSGGSTGISDIPVVIVNLDNDQLGDVLVNLFNSEKLADLMEPTNSSDPETARKLIDSDEASVAIIILEGFSIQWVEGGIPYSVGGLGLSRVLAHQIAEQLESLDMNIWQERLMQ